MITTSSLGNVCDFHLNDHEVDWRGLLGRHDFFVVAGVTEYFSDVGIGSATKMAHELLRNKLSHAQDFPNQWLYEVCGVSSVGFDKSTDATIDAVCNVQDRVFSKFYTTDPHMSFPNALAVLLAFGRYLEGSGNQAHENSRKVEIRYAGYFVEGINEVYRRLPIQEKRLVRRAVQQEEVTLSEMLHARPVTKMTAEHVVRALSLTSIGKRDPSALEVRRHRERKEIYAFRKMWEQKHPEMIDEPRRDQNKAVSRELILREPLNIEEAFRRA